MSPKGWLPRVIINDSHFSIGEILMVFVLKYQMSNARWMAKVIWGLKIYLFRNQLTLTSKEEAARWKVFAFLSYVYINTKKIKKLYLISALCNELAVSRFNFYKIVLNYISID